jgi:Protein of unknown function (DUF3050)
MTDLQTIHPRLSPFIHQIRAHPLYANIQSIAHLRIFMEHHVFAVFDFMCLLKELHRRLVSTQAPWFPPKDAYSARLIHQILVDEEGDLAENGVDYCSHFELYVSAMHGIHANTQPITALVQQLQHGIPLHTAMAALRLPDSIQRFVSTTFRFFEQETSELAAAFVYGREAITPALFTPLLYRLERSLTQDEEASSLSTITYYFQRHIHLDQEDHFPQALQMLKNIAGSDTHKWLAIESAAHRALQARLDFLTGIQDAIQDFSVTDSSKISRPSGAACS